MRIGRSAIGAALSVALVTSVSPDTLSAQAAGVAAAEVSPQRALVDQYCVTCHNGDFVDGTDEPRSLLVSQLRAVGLALDDVDVDHVGEHPEIWENVVRKLRVGAMPPQHVPCDVRYVLLRSAGTRGLCWTGEAPSNT